MESSSFDRLAAAVHHRDARDHLFEAMANGEVTGDQALWLALAISAAEED